jgi:hypothetical protein
VLSNHSRFSGFCGLSAMRGDARGLGGKQRSRQSFDRQKLKKRYSVLRRRAVSFKFSCFVWRLSFFSLESHRNGLSRGG